MYLVITKNLYYQQDAEDKAVAEICTQTPAGGLYDTVFNSLFKARHYIAYHADGDSAGAFNTCWAALRNYGLSLNSEGKIYPSGSFDVVGFQTFLPRFLAEQEKRGIASPIVL